MSQSRRYHVVQVKALGGAMADNRPQKVGVLAVDGLDRIEFTSADPRWRIGDAVDVEITAVTS